MNGTTSIMDVTLGGSTFGSVIVVISLVYTLVYLEMIEASDRSYGETKRVLLAIAILLGFSFAGIVYSGFQQVIS